jgi:hypothetical protein
LALVAAPVALHGQSPVGTAFTYQGRLTESGGPATGAYDFEFSLYDDPEYGSVVAGPLEKLAQEVTYGLFTATLDFGPAFSGEARWLEVRVRPAGEGYYTVLSPRQALTPAPYASYALDAPVPHSLAALDGDPLDAVFVDAAGRVGIGTTTPGSPLTVAGQIEAAAGGYKFPDGSVQTTAASASPWGWSGSDIYYTGGNVGIGTETPEASLDVRGATQMETVRVTAGAALQASVAAWGYNDFGQCNVPAPNSGFVAVAGGNWYSLGLKADGSLVAWGANYDGQCNVPAPNSGFVGVAAGDSHSLGLKADGSIVAWGYNAHGECNVPPPNSGFVAVAGGVYHSLGLKADGSIVAWGDNSWGQCNVPAPNSGFVAVARGNYHSLGLKADGSIVAWGANYDGQCNVPAPNSDFTAVAAGRGHSLGLKADGSVVAWGSNVYGECNVPAPNSGFVAVAGGLYHSLGLKADRSIVAWGWNYYGQCNVPAPNTGFVAVAEGVGGHCLGVRGTLGTPALWLNVDSAFKPGSGHWSIWSDRRLKGNIQPLQGALDRVLGLRGVTFEWRNPLTQGGHFGPQIGLIADEVAPVFPDWVGTGPDGYQTLTVSGFEALTAEALRDLRAEKDTQIEELRCENAELRTRLEQLESLLPGLAATGTGGAR